MIKCPICYREHRELNFRTLGSAFRAVCVNCWNSLQADNIIGLREDEDVYIQRRIRPDNVEND